MATALQQLATSLNVPAGCYLVITVHDELSFDVVCQATALVFGTFIPCPWPTPDMDTLVINATSTWQIANGMSAIVAFGKSLFANDVTMVDLTSMGFVKSCLKYGECDDGKFRAEKGLAWLDTIASIRKSADIGQFVVALPAVQSGTQPK
jgi:hypothetical protein